MRGNLSFLPSVFIAFICGSLLFSFLRVLGVSAVQLLFVFLGALAVQLLFVFLGALASWRLSFEQGNRFDVRGVREHVDDTRGRQRVAFAVNQHRRIARERRRIA